MRTRLNLRLLFLLHCSSCSYPRDSSRSESCFGDRLPCCPLCYSLPCRDHGRPIKRTLPCITPQAYPMLRILTLLATVTDSSALMVDLAGVEPASRTLFSLLLTAITLCRLNVAGLLAFHAHSYFKAYTLTFL
jgi:hypothetical protein